MEVIGQRSIQQLLQVDPTLIHKRGQTVWSVIPMIHVLQWKNTMGWTCGERVAPLKMAINFGLGTQPSYRSPHRAGIRMGNPRLA